MALLSRAVQHALKALLDLAEEPQRWRSAGELASSLDLPAPMLEQLLLRLRRAGLLEARRGRRGGYRLARPAAAIPLADVLAALGLSDANPRLPLAADDPGDRVTAALGRRLARALERELARLTLEELLFDLRSSRAELSEEGGLLLG